MSFEDDLRRVEEHLAEARRLVQRQKGLTVRLRAAGANTLDAQRILWLLESNLRRFEQPETASEQTRETSINAQKAYDALNPHPEKTLVDKISIKTNPKDMRLGRSFINCADDARLPDRHPWHPGMSQKLGMFRLV